MGDFNAKTAKRVRFPFFAVSRFSFKSFMKQEEVARRRYREKRVLPEQR